MSKIFKDYYANLCPEEDPAALRPGVGNPQRCYFLFEGDDDEERLGYTAFAVHSMVTGRMVGTIHADRVKKGAFAAIGMVPMVTADFDHIRAKRVLLLIRLGRILWPFSWKFSAFLARRLG